MLDSAINKVVRLTVPTTIEQLSDALESLPHGVRYGVLCDLDEAGQAYRYDAAVHCAYYLGVQSARIMIWRWSCIATEQEANRLRSLVMSLDGPLDAHRANRIFEYATHRTVGNPRPIGKALHALDFSDYPMLAAAPEN
jgi:hypothetical protein